jgi:hypothetical protein
MKIIQFLKDLDARLKCCGRTGNEIVLHEGSI